MDLPAFLTQSEPAEPPLHSLATADGFTIWAVRLWVCAYRHGGAMLPQLRQGFALAGAPEAWLALDEFMTRLLGSVKRPLDVRGVKTSLLSIDELGLLRWLAALQRDASPPPCQHLRAIAAPGIRLAQALADVGLELSTADAEEKTTAEKRRLLH